MRSSAARRCTMLMYSSTCIRHHLATSDACGSSNAIPFPFVAFAAVPLACCSEPPRGNGSHSRDPVSFAGRRRATRLRGSAGVMMAPLRTAPTEPKRAIDATLKEAQKQMRRTKDRATCRVRCHQTVRVCACLYEMNANRIDVPCEFVSKVPLRPTMEPLCDSGALETCIQRVIAAEQPAKDSGDDSRWKRAQESAEPFMQERALRTWITTTNTNKGHAPGIAATRRQWKGMHRGHGPVVATQDPNKQYKRDTRWLYRWRANWCIRNGKFKNGDRLSRESMRAKACP